MTRRMIKYINSLIIILLFAFVALRISGDNSFATQESYDCSSLTDFKGLDIFCENPDSPGTYFNGSTSITYNDITYKYYKIRKDVIVNVTGEIKFNEKAYIEGELDDGEKTVMFLRNTTGIMINLVSNSNVVLKDLIIDGNRDVVTGSSAGIYTKYPLTMENVLFRNFIYNKASGIIYGNIEARANLTVNNCVFDNNKVYKKNGDENNIQGSVIFGNQGKVIITNSKFTRNEAEVNNNSKQNSIIGGIISFVSPTYEISNCTFGDKDNASLGNKVTSNHTTSKKASITGGLFKANIDGSFHNCDFYNNSCINNGNIFGGMICTGTNAEITDCNFQYNYSESGFKLNGGCIFLDSSQGNYIIDGCTFKENKCDNSEYIYGGIISGNYTDANVQRTGKAEIKNSIIENNTAKSNLVMNGGSIYFCSEAKGEGDTTEHLYTVLLDNVDIKNNDYIAVKGFAGGGLYAQDIKTVTMNDITIDNNIGKGNTASGTAMYLYCNDINVDAGEEMIVNLNRSTITNNVTKTSSVGAGAIVTCASFFVSDSEISYNKVIKDIETMEANNYFDYVKLQAGGIYNYMYLDLNNVTMIGNEGNVGGSIYNGGVLNLSGKINIPLGMDDNKIYNEIAFFFDPDDSFSFINMYSLDGSKIYEYDELFDKIGLAFYSYIPGKELIYALDDIDYNKVFRFVKYDIDDSYYLTKELVPSDDIRLFNKQISLYVVSKIGVNINAFNNNELPKIDFSNENVPEELKVTITDDNITKSQFALNMNMSNSLIPKQVPTFEAFVALLHEYYDPYLVTHDIVFNNTNSSITYLDNDKTGRAKVSVEGIPNSSEDSYIFGNADLKYDIVCDISSASDVRLILDGDDKRLYAGGKIVDSDVSFSNYNVDPSGTITIDADCGNDYDTLNGDYYKGSKTGIVAKEISFVEQDDTENVHIELTNDTRLYNTVKCDVKDIVDNAEKSEIKLNIKEKNISDLNSLSLDTKTKLNELKDSKKEVGVYDIYVSRTDTNRLSGSVIDEKQNLYSDKTLTLELNVNKPSGNYKNYKLLHVLDDGNVVDTNATITTEGDIIKFVFSVSEFSDFVLVADEENTSGGGGSSHKKNKDDTDSNTKVEEEHKSIIAGYEDGTFRPNGFVTREEMATLIARLSNDYDEKIDYTKYITDDNILDVPLDYWSANYIGYVVKNNIMNMVNNNSFYPQRKLTRGELCKIICSFKNFELTNNNSRFTDTNGKWYEAYVSTLENINYINGYLDGTFKGDNNITRAELSKVICIMQERDIKDISKITTKLKNELKEKYYDIDINEWYLPYVFEISYDHKVSFVH